MQRLSGAVKKVVLERHRWKRVYSILRIAATYIISILNYQKEKNYMASCALLCLPSFDIYVGPNSENNLSAVLL